jgi:hypothetical protein
LVAGSSSASSLGGAGLVGRRGRNDGSWGRSVLLPLTPSSASVDRREVLRSVRRDFGEGLAGSSGEVRGWGAGGDKWGSGGVE